MIEFGAGYGLHCGNNLATIHQNNFSPFIEPFKMLYATTPDTFIAATTEYLGFRLAGCVEIAGSPLVCNAIQ